MCRMNQPGRGLSLFLQLYVLGEETLTNYYAQLWKRLAIVRFPHLDILDKPISWRVLMKGLFVDQYTQ